MNASYGVIRSASSKCWTTVTSTPAAARRSSRSAGSHRSGGAAPTRISSGWWSKVMTVGRASRARAPRTSRRSRYMWPRCSPSKTPTTTKSRPIERSRASTPSTTITPGPRAGLPAGLLGHVRGPLGEVAGRRRVHEHLVGQERRTPPVPDRDEPAARVEHPDRSVDGIALRRPDGLAAGDARQVRRVQRERRERLEARVERQEEGGDRSACPARPRRPLRPVRPSPPAASRSTSSETASSIRNGPLAVRTSAPRYAALPSAAPRSRAIARMYVPAEHSTSTIGDRTVRVRAVPVHEVQTGDRDGPRPQLERAARARHGVGPATGDLDGRIGRRRLLDRPPERAEGPLDGRPVRRRARARASAHLRGRPSWTTPRSTRSPGRPWRRPGGTRRPASPAPGTAAGRRSRTDRGCRRARPAAWR